MALEELLNTNKENYLELDNDPAKPVNDAVEQQQKQMSAHFEAAIQEAYRVADANVKKMKQFNCVEFDIGDIVRSGFVRDYLIQKTKLGIGVE